MSEALLKVMQSRLGIKEVSGKGHNPVIVGWAKAIGHPEVTDDETAWCSTACCSAALEAGLPMPPHNVRLLARSWLTWGAKVDPDDIQPSDVAVWPRGKSSWQGHVNVVEQVTDIGQVICIGGNQNNAVTRTKPLDPKGALGFRRAIPATVDALRKAGSSEVKKADKIQNGGWIVTIIPATIAAITDMLGPVEVPKFVDLKEGLSWWQEILGGVKAIGGLIGGHPWLVGTCIVGALCVLIGRQLKTKRVEKHAAGVPLSIEVAKMETANAG